MDLMLKQEMPTPMSQQYVYSLLQACTKRKDLAAARQVHCLMVNDALDSVALLGEPLIRLFSSSRSLFEASIAFCVVAKPTVYTWHAIISAHATLGQNARVLELHNRMQLDGINPNNHVFPCILNACSSIGDLGQGQFIHDDIIRSGFESDVVIGSSLLDMYAKCGSLEESQRVFDNMPDRDVVSWGAMIAGYAHHGQGLPALQLFTIMQQKDIKPTKVTFLSILKACGCIAVFGKGKLVHDQIIRSGVESDLIIGNSLVDMYVKCGSLEDACKVFEKMANRDVISYGAMITGYAQQGQGVPALHLFEEMQQKGINSNKVTHLCILKACSSIGALDQGKIMHDHIIKSGLESDLVFGNTLIDMYAKCGCLDEAFRVFDELPNHDAVSWGAMTAGFVQCGYGPLVMKLFTEMQHDGVDLEKVNCLAILKACCCTGTIVQGKVIHDQIIRNGVELDAAVGSTLVDMYAKCGSLDEAGKVFHSLSDRDIVSWGAMIAGYAQQGHGLHALELFETMQDDGINPDKIIFLSVLKSCSSIGALGQGKWIHDLIIRDGFELDVILGSTVIDMYVKCGNLKESQKVFDKMPNQDVVLWGVMIAGYAQHGKYAHAKQCLKEMQNQGLKPHGMIYTSILLACSNSGHVEEGHLYFRSMIKEHGILPTVEHFNCMVDLLGRAGRLNEAERLLHTMPFLPDVVGWTSLLTASRMYGNMELGKRCFEQIKQVDLNVSSGHMLMFNLYADAHMWEDVEKIHKLRNFATAWNMPGKAWIDARNDTHEFTVGDKSHPESSSLNVNLNRLTRSIKQLGYVPQVIFISEKHSDK